ncbi:hypothetical protein QBC47DRAFT_358362 [Echria macrotheca]|uniref:Altered inheritance of mitochondria protein 11 n=1 Tax=Echria macrotheca TaxID=438768 RepID=A0AAJ0FCN0_9PEZI|nr:hypothetical protein QBC47DRAFT_358362 [Echria macrotheca]
MPILSSLLSSLIGVEKTPTSPPNAPVQAQPASSSPATPNPPKAVAPKVPIYEPREPTPVLSRRSFRQLGLYFGGCVFMGLSILITRRAVSRHILRSRPKFFSTNTYSLTASTLGPGKEAVLEETKKDPLIALEALNLATLNVFSFAIMMAGGASWALDLSSIEDVKTLAQRSLHRNAVNIDEEEEQEVTEWFAKALGMNIPPSEQGAATADEGGEGGEKKP